MDPEDLRPRTLDTMVGQAQSIRILRGLIEKSRTNGVVPHLMFSGPPGVGKTTAAHAFAKELLSDNFGGNFLEMNASNERKIEDVRETIASYVGHEPQYGAEFKFLFLDEFDEMTPTAQAALRRIMEEGSGTTRFILSCNKPHKVLDAIRSRCLNLAFRPLSDDEIRVVIANTAKALAIQPDPKLVESIVAHVDGQARDAVFALIGGDEQSEKWARLDDRIKIMLTPNGSDPSARIEAFAQFLRQDGFSDYEVVMDTILKVGRRDSLIPPVKFPQAIETIGQYARWLNQVDVPLLQVRSSLYALARILGGN